ncbi:MAG: UDP-2,3-diacylglucosamine diphosphatase [Brachymonas sp.]|nr:UDP-2,3-diacylglucosamine diphosphatase [Brachymonas sp.]
MQTKTFFFGAWQRIITARVADTRAAGIHFPLDPTPTNKEENSKSDRYRTVWISDLHLGTKGCQAAALLDFLKHTECETLYLVGDVVDGWQLRRHWYWPQLHNDVVQKILRKVRKGTRVIFIPGNHDEFARKYLGLNFGGIEVADEWLHETADGRKLWITHGDYFDGVIQCAKWLAYVGDNLYELALKLNSRLNRWRARMGLPYWSLSSYLKHKVKRAVNYVSDFEDAVAKEALRRGAHGVVCGHIHHAELREINGITYANDGDWVESLTALAEHADGRLEILRWAEHMALRERLDDTIPTQPVATYTPVAQTAFSVQDEEAAKPPFCEEECSVN